MYVCMYACLHACIRACIMHANVHACNHAHACMSMYAHAGKRVMHWHGMHHACTCEKNPDKLGGESHRFHVHAKSMRACPHDLGSTPQQRPAGAVGCHLAPAQSTRSTLLAVHAKEGGKGNHFNSLRRRFAAICFPCTPLEEALCPSYKLHKLLVYRAAVS